MSMVSTTGMVQDQRYGYSQCYGYGQCYGYDQ